MNRIHFLQAVWNDVILLESRGRFALVDTGFAHRYDEIAAYLRGVGVTELEFIFVTHFHRDHDGCVNRLVQEFPVRVVYVKKYSALEAFTAEGKPADQAYREQETLRYRQMLDCVEANSRLCVITPRLTTVQVGEQVYHVYGNEDVLDRLYYDAESPFRGQIRFGENLNSAALFGVVAGRGIFLGGDVCDSAVGYPVADDQNTAYARAIGRQADIYKVPHHGCGHCTDHAAMEIYRPRYAIVTNRTETFEGRLSDIRDRFLQGSPGVQILLTDRCGYLFTIAPTGEIDYRPIEAGI
ncbi:MAG: MBL fold metallo-hydrolase [Eubacteriales bacterium]